MHIPQTEPTPFPGLRGQSRVPFLEHPVHFVDVSPELRVKHVFGTRDGGFESRLGHHPSWEHGPSFCGLLVVMRHIGCPCTAQVLGGRRKDKSGGGVIFKGLLYFVWPLFFGLEIFCLIILEYSERPAAPPKWKAGVSTTGTTSITGNVGVEQGCLGGFLT